jgi:hypothetical protein
MIVTVLTTAACSGENQTPLYPLCIFLIILNGQDSAVAAYMTMLKFLEGAHQWMCFSTLLRVAQKSPQ